MTDFPTGILFKEARAIVARLGDDHRTAIESIATTRTHGRVLARSMIAPIDLPPFDNSAMDGYAFRHADLAGEGVTVFRLAGEQFAGCARDLPLASVECVRITTGAPMPADADTVVVQENVTLSESGVCISSMVPIGANVRHAGEDVRAGTCVLASGCTLTPARVAIAASLGVDQLAVAARPTVAVFTTGDELVEPGMPLQPGEIYNSNRELLLGLLRAEGLEPTAWPTLPDDPERIRAALLDAASSFDVVMTCGAVSAGAKDHIPALLQTEGRVHFWKVRMKPGMPVLCGQVGRAVFLGLPGNPVSVLATWLTLGRTLTDGMQGRTEPRRTMRARLTAAIDKTHARREFIRGRLFMDDDAVLHVEPNPATGSHRLLAAAQSDALIVVPEGPQQLSQGAVVEVLPY